MLISPAYREMNEQMHSTKPHYGDGGARHKDEVLELARRIGAETILDYAAGKMRLAEAITTIPVFSYDPGIPAISAPPEPADLVTCTDALEHIEPDCLGAVIFDLKRLAKKAVFLSVHTGPAAKHLPDGRNAHLIQRPVKWWLPLLMSHWDLVTVIVAERGFVFIGGKQRV